MKQTPVCSTPVFIDWADLFQRHGSDTLPVVGSGRQVRTDLDMDKLEAETIRKLNFEGSHSTQVQVWSDGHAQCLRGNVGRWGRPDNVWNLDWADTLAKANTIAQEHGLRDFTPGEHYLKDSVSKHDAERGIFEGWTGARCSRLDVTANYQTGSHEMARHLFQFVGGLRAARISKSRLGETTLVWGSGGSAKQVELYLKGPELLAHAKGDLEKARVKKSDIYQFCMDVGLVRIECKWRRGFLRDHGMNFVGGINMGKIEALYRRETAFLLDANPDRLVHLVDAMPKKLKLYALAWMDGRDVAGMVSRATFYRVAKGLREYGLDIAEPRAASSHAEEDLQKMLDALPRFSLRPLGMPEWYEASSYERKAA
ncbi:MAG: hypothetical protein JSR19_01390 [Proteobacteria bacterium]|nr:hypothetical protein [Pseudomonadota bacterium]HQR02503.1 phage/plasmid replication protein [Rhodocyclaceae bacterium]